MWGMDCIFDIVYQIDFIGFFVGVIVIYEQVLEGVLLWVEQGGCGLELWFIIDVMKMYGFGFVVVMVFSYFKQVVEVGLLEKEDGVYYWVVFLGD